MASNVEWAWCPQCGDREDHDEVGTVWICRTCECPNDNLGKVKNMSLLDRVAGLFKRISPDVYSMSDIEINEHLESLTKDQEEIRKAKEMIHKAKGDHESNKGVKI